DCPLVAHNLAFDETMVRMNINNIESSSLLNRFNSIRNGILIDSLAVARKLFPQLKSHKLGDLLKTFNLEGVNSHNALDDVKATSSLVQYMINILRDRLSKIDSLIDSDRYRNVVYGFSKQWNMIDKLVRARTQNTTHLELHEILTFWLDYAYDNNMYSGFNKENIQKEVEEKLIPFLIRNNYQGLFEHLMDDTKERAETLYTLKESDLITEDHKVVISTVHRAKGLEFDTVIVPQVTDSNYPGWIPPNTPSAEIEERREESKRLLYVALSRAKHKLLVSYHQRYTTDTNSFGYAKKISPFLEQCIGDFSWSNLK
ncbi:3'-5' exonuclease, partial [uncultured Pseudoalteromonas sp.]|uniref:3'-5' exonuclease n=1 Tax=uncultured Pseudoalteromonas sp. TaxID=114053 RepID=UPI002599835F